MTVSAMFIVHGQSTSVDAVVGTSNARKAVSHYNRMILAGLLASITDEEGRAYNPRALSHAYAAPRGFRKP